MMPALAVIVAVATLTVMEPTVVPDIELQLERSQKAKRAFVHEHPCPANGKIVTSCPGYVIDHVIPLCAGGPDTPGNMQWQTLRAGAAKDKREIAYCACLRAKRTSCTFKP